MSYRSKLLAPKATSMYLLALLSCVLWQLSSVSTAFSASPKESSLSAPKNSKENTVKKREPAQLLIRPKIGSKHELPVVFRKSKPDSIDDLQSIEQYVQKLVQKVSPAVVAVEINNGSGSGVVISPDGLVLTAGHVCEKENQDARFTFADGKTVRGKTIGIGSDNDTGLMRITDAGPWPYVDTGDVESAHRGDWVLAFGHPGGFDLGRSLVVRLGRLIRLSPDLQTDCTISPGDSGGPLIDMHGRVIGIHSFISSSMSANFHVPMTAFFDEWDTMVSPVTTVAQDRLPGFVGVRVVDAPSGCRLTEIDKDSPAAKAGLKVGDIVLKVDGREIWSAGFFRRCVEEAAPGDSLNLNIRRGEKLMSFNVKLGKGQS
jgi:serine protease Do